MRTLKTIVCVSIASCFIAGCSFDTGSNGDQVQGGAQAMNPYQPAAASADCGVTFRVGLTANSAGGSCIPDYEDGSRCNLRGALDAAPTARGPVTIVLDAAQTIETDEIDLPLPVTERGYHVIVRGAVDGSPTAIAGYGASRLFRVPAGVTLDLVNVDISGFAANDEGGTIVNYGTVNIQESIISYSQVVCDGTGAMYATVTCGGGAIANHGTMSLGTGTRFEKNKVSATTTNGSFSTATAFGGAIVSDGTLAVAGGVVFALNSVLADASSGPHGMPGGVEASAFGGAIYNGGGKLMVTGPAESNSFFANATWAWGAVAEWGQAITTSRGGAIASVGGTFVMDPAACILRSNGADVDMDVYATPGDLR